RLLPWVNDGSGGAASPRALAGAANVATAAAEAAPGRPGQRLGRARGPARRLARVCRRDRLRPHQRGAGPSGHRGALRPVGPPRRDSHHPRRGRRVGTPERSRRGEPLSRSRPILGGDVRIGVGASPRARLGLGPRAGPPRPSAALTGGRHLIQISKVQPGQADGTFPPARTTFYHWSTLTLPIALRQLPLTLRSDGRSLQAAIYEGLKQAMQEGRLRPGSLLPSTRDFARQLRVARGTVVQVYGQLAGEGYLSGSRGAGTRVVETLPEKWLSPERARSSAPPVGG